MSTFYLLPPRPVLGERLAGFLQGVLPGLDWDTATRSQLAEAVAVVAAQQNVFVVYREDLRAAGEPPARALMRRLWGCEVGDEVIEVRPRERTQPGELTSRRWKILSTRLAA